MPIDFKVLGKTEEMQQRRYKVLQYYLKGASAREIADLMDLTKKKVYNDLDYIRQTPLHNLPLSIVRDLGNSFYEMKIRELESDLSKARRQNTNPSYILGLEKLIQKYKMESLKLQGAYVDKIEHSGSVDHTGGVVVYIPDNGRDDESSQD